jgi:integrase
MDADTFAAFLAMQGMADNSIRNYRALYLRWVDYAVGHGRDPHQPDPLTVRAWTSQLHGSRSLIAQARATIGHLCRACQTTDVSTVVPLPRQPKAHQRGLDRADAVALADQARRAGLPGLAVLVGLYTAARRGEIASLCWRRIDLEQRTVTLERPKVRDLHTVPMHPQLASHLAERRVPGELWVFPGRHGGHVSPTTIGTWTDRVAAAAALRGVTPHRLRHTALTEAYDATRDLRAVQDLAGHTDPAVTARYTRVSGSALRAAVGSLDYGA